MRTIVIGVVLSLRQPYLLEIVVKMSGVSILISYKEKPPGVKLPIFSEFMENSTNPPFPLSFFEHNDFPLRGGHLFKSF